MLMDAWKIDYLCAVAYVPQRSHRALTLRYCEGDSVAAVGAQMDVSADAVQALISRGWGKIRDWYSELTEGEEAGWVQEACHLSETVDQERPAALTASHYDHVAALRLAIGDRHLSREVIGRAVADLAWLRDHERDRPFVATRAALVNGRRYQVIERVPALALST